MRYDPRPETKTCSVRLYVCRMYFDSASWRAGGGGRGELSEGSRKGGVEQGRREGNKRRNRRVP